jgi:hypothetical protein
MSVSYTGVSQNLTASQVLFYGENAIKALAQAAMVNMAEANVEMLTDCPNEYPTKADVERVFQGLNEQATDFLNDVFEDFKERLLKELATKKYTARVSAMRYNDLGELDDIDVKVDFQ